MSRRQTLWVLSLGVLALALLVGTRQDDAAPSVPSGPPSTSTPPDADPDSSVGTEAEAQEAPAPRGPPATGPSIVLVSIDTMRADHVGSAGYEPATTPFLDELASRGVRYSRAYATSSWTAPSVASMLTGLYPGRHGVTRGHVGRQRRVVEQQALPVAAPTLAERLRAAGYRTYAATANGHLAPELGFARGFDDYRHIGFGPLRRLRPEVDAVVAQLEGEGAWFLWIHVFDPHAPYLPYGSALDRLWPAPRERFEDLERLRIARRANDLDLTGERGLYLQALYDSELRRVDDFLRGLDEQLPGDPLWLVTSDHGEEFGDHGGHGHGNNLFEETIRVPWVMRYPEDAHAGTVVHAPVSLVDLAPTLLSAASAAPLAITDGVVLDPTSPGVERVVFASLSRGGQRRAAIDGTLKLDSKLPDGARLFDLDADPHERSDLMSARRADAARLQVDLVEHEERMNAGRLEGSRLEADEDTAAQLRALGYAQ